MCVYPETSNYTEQIGDSLDVSKRSQWILSHVSRRWRALALNIAKLWSSIELRFDMYGTCNQIKLQYMLGLMLERSRGHDIVIAIYSEEDISSLGGLTVLLAGISRCMELTLFIPYVSLPAFSMCRGSLSQLRHLFLQFTDDVPLEVTEVEFFDLAPCLQRLSVYGRVYFSQLFRLLWTQIDKCWIKSSSNDVILDVLEKVSSVETITVTTNGPSIERTSSRILELPRVKEICIQEDDDDNQEAQGALTQLLMNLKLPTLQKLSIDFNSAVPCFPEIYRAPLFNLVDLTICCDLSDVDAGRGVGEFLRLTHHVKRLNLRVRSVNERFFALFFCQPDQPVLLPCLEELDLRESNLVNQSYILVNMLDSRCRDSGDCARLTRVWLDCTLGR